jgi:SAM-dependent methyltransferase
MEKVDNLILGCGETRVPGAVHIDKNELVKPDVIHDLNSFPYPFEDNSVCHIQAFHIIEHLSDPFDVMREFYRILKPNGKLHIKVPHCSRGFTHSQHKSGFDVAFPLYFDKSFTLSGYFGIDFKCEKNELHWLGNQHLLKYIGIKNWQITILQTLNFFINMLAGMNPYVCSRFWAYWVGGFDEIEFEFTCIKEASNDSKESELESNA